MKLASVELLRLKMPLVSPFRTSFGVQTGRDVLVVVVHTTDGVSGYGECVALADPIYNEEYVDGAEHVLARYLVPPCWAIHTSPPRTSLASPAASWGTGWRRPRWSSRCSTRSYARCT